MADDPGRRVDCRAKDLELLESGNFADVEVVCGDRTWKCHRAVLVPRSVWFEKALAGPFEEASTRRVKLDDENPACVDLALKYIYGRGLDVQSSISPEHFVEHCVCLWHIADFLLLGPLKSTVQRAVHDYCDKRMKELCTVGPGWFSWTAKDDRSKLSPLAVDLISGIRESYRWSTEHLKAVLLEFLWVGRFHTLHTATVSHVTNHLKEIPDFTNDLLSRYATGVWIHTAVWAPASCKVFRDAPAKRTCRRCVKKIHWSTHAKAEGQTCDPFELSPTATVTSGWWCRDCSKLDTIPWRT